MSKIENHELKYLKIELVKFLKIINKLKDKI